VDRRGFIQALAGGLLAAPLAAEAESGSQVRRIGILSVEAVPSDEQLARSSLRAALKELGWIMGQNLVFERRFAGGQPDRLPALAAELVELKVDVIVTVLNQETLAAKQATASIPIVMTLGVYPVQAGLVASLARPGGNVTGTSTGPISGGKYLELLKEALPKLARVAILLDPTFPGLADSASDAESAARKLGLTLTGIPVSRTDDLDRALARIANERFGALWVVPIGPLAARAQQIINFATSQALPTIFPARFFAESGALMSYGHDPEYLLRRAASYIDRILRGAKPGDLPVEQSTKFELVINLKTAKALGLTIPPSLLARVDQTIE
jgi:putative tryptophan/tyrosine transport system substrate-binding protein